MMSSAGYRSGQPWPGSGLLKEDRFSDMDTIEGTLTSPPLATGGTHSGGGARHGHQGKAISSNLEVNGGGGPGLGLVLPLLDSGQIVITISHPTDSQNLPRTKPCHLMVSPGSDEITSVSCLASPRVQQDSLGTRATTVSPCYDYLVPQLDTGMVPQLERQFRPIGPGVGHLTVQSHMGSIIESSNDHKPC